MQQLRGIVKYFDRYRDADTQGSAEGFNPADPVPDHIDRLYFSYADLALKICEGDMQRADYFQDCGVFEFYYRIQTHNRYVHWHNEQVKKASGKG